MRGVVKWRNVYKQQQKAINPGAAESAEDERKLLRLRNRQIQIELRAERSTAGKKTLKDELEQNRARLIELERVQLTC